MPDLRPTAGGRARTVLLQAVRRRGPAPLADWRVSHPDERGARLRRRARRRLGLRRPHHVLRPVKCREIRSSPAAPWAADPAGRRRLGHAERIGETLHPIHATRGGKRLGHRDHDGRPEKDGRPRIRARDGSPHVQGTNRAHGRRFRPRDFVGCVLPPPARELRGGRAFSKPCRHSCLNLRGEMPCKFRT